MLETPFPRSSDFTIGPGLSAASKFVRILEMAVGPTDRGHTCAARGSALSRGREGVQCLSAEVVEAVIECRCQMAKQFGQCLRGKRRQHGEKEGERGGYLQHEEEGEKKRTRERRSLNSRLWAAPLKVVEIREEPRKERGEDERPATDGRTERTDLTTES